MSKKIIFISLLFLTNSICCNMSAESNYDQLINEDQFQDEEYLKEFDTDYNQFDNDDYSNLFNDEAASTLSNENEDFSLETSEVVE